MFWSDFGANPRIERANLEGGDRITFVSTDVVRPIGMAVEGERVYWVDDGTDSVESVDLDGGQRRSFQVDKTPNARHNLFGIATYEVLTLTCRFEYFHI
jgi:sugar lactone lactonase YvrE